MTDITNLRFQQYNTQTVLLQSLVFQLISKFKIWTDKENQSFIWNNDFIIC